MLSTPGVTWQQIVWLANSPDARVAITRVSIERGAISRRHSRPHAEQRIAEEGTATMLLADDQTRIITAGEVLRTPAGETHGVVNTGERASCT